MIALNRRVLLMVFFVFIVVGFSLLPGQAASTFGRWRDITPTQYIAADPSGTLRGVYVYSSSGSASIGSGDGWVVGGDNFTGIISHYDGFSWQILSPPVTTAVYNAVNFCLTPGAPNVGSLCNPYTANGYVADGWLVGGSRTAFGTCVTTICPVATYWNGGTLTEKDDGLSANLAGNLTSVFMACNSPETGQLGCSGPFQSQGLTYAVGQNVAATHGIICDFNGDPLAGGSWVCPFTSTHATKFNSVYMYVDQTGNIGGFAVGDAGTIAQLTSGAWTESQPAVGVTFRSVFVDQGGNNLEAWAVGDALAGSAQIWHFCCGPAGSWNGPVSPGATTHNLESVFLTSTTTGWAFGTGSVILYSNTLGTSNQWLALTSASQTATGPGINLFSGSFPNSGAGWTVGSKGVILDTQNSNCGNAIQFPCWGGNTAITQAANLTAVFEVGKDDAWAGGWWDFNNTMPSLIHWDGVKWHRAQIAPPPQLGGRPFNITGIYMSGSSDGWAVGGNATGNVPFALHWDGNAWTGAAASQPVCTCALTSVFMINSGEGWAVGSGGQFFHYTSNTNQWGLTQAALGAPKLNGVFIDNPGSNQFAGWAVGNGGIVYALSISGSTATWNQVTIPALLGTTPNLYGVFFTDSNHGWIVGAGGTILTTTNGGQGWSGGQNQVIGLSSPPTLRSVYVDNSNTGAGNGDGWAVGGTNETGTADAVFAHWDGSIWSATTISPPIAPGLALNSVYGQPGNTQDGWAVGAGPKYVTFPLDGIFHLDPLNPPIYGSGGAGTTTIVSTSTSGGVSSTFTTTSTSATTTTTSTSTSVVTESTTSTSTSPTTSTSTSVSTETSTVFSSNTMQIPGIPGFPWESIVAGIIVGLVAVGIIRRTKK